MELLLLGALAVAGALWLAHAFLARNYAFWKQRGVPFVAPSVPFGTVKDVILGRRSDGDVFKDQYDMFPNERFVGGFRMGHPYLLIRDLDLVKHVTVKDFEHFHDRVFPVDEDKRPLSPHLFNLQGKRWRALRAKLTPAFTSGKMKLMFNLMADCANILTKHLDAKAENQEEIEMREALAQFTTDIIGTCALGLQMNAIENPDSEFRRAGREVFEPSILKTIKRFTLILLPPLADLLGLSFEGHGVTRFFTKAVKDMVDFREKNDVKRGDFIDLLLQLKHRGKVDEDAALDQSDRLVANAVKSADDIDMTDNLFAAQVWVFFLAGFETSSTASSFAMYELAVNPDLQERLRDEVDQTMAANGGKLTYDAIVGMKYLDKVWNESLRKYSPVRGLIRQVTKEYTIPGTNVQLPKGIWVDIPTWAIHYDPKYYPNPERFDPERFSEEEKAKRHHYAFLPFGEGPRICIGMRFGILQGKLALATLLSRYRFSVCERTHVPLRLDPNSLVTASKDGIWLKIQPR